jgi:translocation and assembly module TamA
VAWPAGFARRRALWLALACSSALVVAGAANAFEIFGMKFFEPQQDAIEVVDPLNYTVTLTVQGDNAKVKEAMERTSSLLADKERPVSGSLGLISKARSDREQLIAALFELARYDGLVDITIQGRPIDEIPPDAKFGAGPVPVTVTIHPGHVYTLGDVALAGDAAGLDAAEFGLVPGGDAGSLVVLRAESNVVRRLRSEGRPLAKVTNREVIADHDTRTLDVKLTLEAGPVATFGTVTVDGAKTVDADFIAYMADLPAGRTYSPQDIDDARDRLVNLGVFASVTVTEADKLAPDGSIPIKIDVSERKHRYYGFGATISSTEGAGIEGYWGHRNLFGHAEQLRIEGKVANIGNRTDFAELTYGAKILFEKPGVIGPNSRFFTGLEGLKDNPDAYDSSIVKFNAGVAYDLTKKQSVSAEVAVEYGDVEDYYGRNTYLLVSVPLQYVYDNRDDKLNPTSGYRALAFVQPAHDFLDGVTFVKMRAEGSAYYSFDKENAVIAAGRLAVGSIVGASLLDVPANHRFYAGGGGSVRGYPYQGIGPKAPNGDPIGGLSVVEGSAELRIAVTETISVVPFVDAANVSENEFPSLDDIRVGAGVGVRYMTPFGPLRIDGAIPLNRYPGDPNFGIYAGIGQAF